MKLKKSFFNKTLFKKNLTLYWPLWTVYTIILVFIQPVMLWINLYNSRFAKLYTYEEKVEDLISVLGLDIHVWMVAFMALATGMAMYHYLYQHKSANMLHAFPVDRNQLFGSNVISGISFMVVPQAISALLTIVTALCYGITDVQYVGIWFLCMFGVDIIAFSIITFCAMLTGHILALPVYAYILNFLSLGLYYLVNGIVVMYGFGVDSIGNKAKQIASLFCPLECLMNYVGLRIQRNEIHDFAGVVVEGEYILCLYLVAAVVLYVLAYLFYQKRHVEQAGEFITVAWLRPVFRFGVGFTGGVLGSVFLREILRTMGISCNVVIFIIMLLVLSAGAYFIADMLIHKSFHVFKKQNMLRCGIHLVVVFVTFLGLYGIAKKHEAYMPKLSEIDRASIRMGYDITLEGEETAVILEIQKAIIENKEICIEDTKNLFSEYEYVNIDYQLKDGQYISRGYMVPFVNPKTAAIIDKIAVMEQDSENYIVSLLGENYEQIEMFNGGYFQAQFKVNSPMSEEGEIFYETMDLNAEQAKELFEAALADIRAGNMMKYNIDSEWVREDENMEMWKVSDASIQIEYFAPDEDENETQEWYVENDFYGVTDSVTSEYRGWNSLYLSIGPDCEHVMNKLIEFGFVKSVNDIYWGDLK